MAKATKKQALGRGLSALLKDSTTEKLIGSIIDLNLDWIEVNPYQPRFHFDSEALQELANSIKELGIVQPITVRKLDTEKYQLVSGERRFRASKLIENKTIPAYIRTANDQEMLEMALVENIQRKDLDPIEVALSYQRLIDEINLTQEEMSKRVGKKRSTISNYLRLLKLDPIIQTGIRDKFISMGHGRAIININDQDEQLTIYEKILKGKLSVRQTENLVKTIKDGIPDTDHTKIPQVPFYVKNNLGELQEHFNCNVRVKMMKNNNGKIVIPFSSEKDFIRIKKLLQ
ncbi:MAG: ParB/RepB/Spo0J family partition protein [Flavobacteriaceae bacterium]|nr:ParB/RepB/Spo0J family partition protein [Flavobacteriaceae bacterium]